MVEHKMIPESLFILALALFGVVAGGAVWYFLSNNQHHYALWSAVVAVIIYVVAAAGYIHNWITSKEAERLLLPKISISIFPLVAGNMSSAHATQYKYPLDEYTLSVFNDNKKSAPVCDLTIEFSFPYLVSGVKGGPVLETGANVTVGRLKVVEMEGDRTTATEEQPISTPLDNMFSLESQTSRQGEVSIPSNVVVFFCKEWPEIAFYEGSIIVDLGKKLSIVKKAYEIGRFTGRYSYRIGDKKYSGNIQGLIPKPDLTIKLAEIHFIKGKEYAGREDFKSAVSEYSESINLYPEFAEAYGRRAYSYIKNGEYENAIADCDRAITLSPRYADAYCNRASAKAKLARYEEAIVDYSSYIEMKPIDPDGYFGRALAYCFVDQYEKALLDCNKALELRVAHERYPNFAQIFFNAGNFYKRHKKLAEAKGCYDRAIELNSEYADAYNNRAIVYSLNRQYIDAVRDCTQAIQINPNLSEAYGNRAFVYKSLGELDNAVKDFKKACDLGLKQACEEYKGLRSNGHNENSHK